MFFARVAAVTFALVLAQTAAADVITVKLIAFNDFHGNLQSPGAYRHAASGGADALAAYVNRLKRQNPLNIVVAAGDLIGASPLISASFHHESTIEALNLVGLELSAVGNHEFDRGKAELLRMQRGGCDPADPANSCQGPDHTFAGAKFNYLAANVIDTATGATLFPPYRVQRFDGVPVAFIGAVLKGTPGIVTAAGVAGLEFRDEADTINALVPELRAQGIESIVVLIHEGGFAHGGINACERMRGAIVEIVQRLDPAIDAVVSGHTHQPYVCRLPNRDGRPVLVTSAAAFGHLVTDIDLGIDRDTRDVVDAKAVNIVVTRSRVRPDARVAALVGHYDALIAPRANRVVGRLSADISNVASASGETAAGNLIADAQLAATAAGGAVMAFMNRGGIRGGEPVLRFAQSGTEGDGNVTYAEAFTLQPFGNSLVTMTLSGAQIETLLEQQWSATQPAGGRILQVSSGFSYTWDCAAPVGKRVVAGSVKLNGEALDPAKSYRVTVNSFLAGSGDEFTVLKDGGDRRGGPDDLDAFVAYLGARGTVSPPPLGRISRVSSNPGACN